MRRFPLMVVVTVALLALLAPPAAAITNGEPDGERHPNVGAFLVFDEGVWWQACTGTSVAPNRFLTAAHCVDWIPAGMPAAVTFDRDIDEDPPGSGIVHPDYMDPVTSWIWHPDYRATFAKGYNDVAVVTFVQSIQVTPVQLPALGFLDTETAHGGLRGHVFVNVGYGVQSLQKSILNPQVEVFADGQRMLSTSPFMGLTPDYLKLLTATAATGQGGICFGDSGGPHFFSDVPGDTSYNLEVAITAASDPNCQALSENQRLDTRVVTEWLDTVLP